MSIDIYIDGVNIKKMYKWYKTITELIIDLL